MEVRDIDSDCEYEKLKFSGSAYTNDFSSFSIGQSIVWAFNEIHRFECVKDIIDYQIIKDRSKYELEDEIVNIAKVIALCKKYQEINPVFPYERNLRDWIEKSINSIIQAANTENK